MPDPQLPPAPPSVPHLPPTGARPTLPHARQASSAVVSAPPVPAHVALVGAASPPAWDEPEPVPAFPAAPTADTAGEVPLSTAAPARLLRMRWLELALVATQLAFAAVLALVSIELLAGWRDADAGGGVTRAVEVVERLDLLFVCAFAAGAAVSLTMVAWTVVAAVNGRRISLFAPHWAAIAGGWAVGPALIVWGLSGDGMLNAWAISVGALLSTVAPAVGVATLRRTAQIVGGDGRALGHWLVALIAGAFLSGWVARGIDVATSPAAVLRNAGIAFAVDALVQLGLAALALRAARQLRTAYAGQPRVHRSRERFVADSRGVPLGAMSGVRSAMLAGIVGALVIGSGALAFIDLGAVRGRTMNADQLRLVQDLVAAVWAFVWLTIVVWTGSVARNAAKLSGRSAFGAIASSVVWWFGAPVALVLITIDSGPVPKLAVAVSAVLALIGHVQLAALSTCEDMRYLAWGATVCWLTGAGGLVLDADAADLPTSATAASGDLSWRTISILLLSAVLLMVLVRVGRSLERVERAVRARKDQLIPMPELQLDPAAFFTRRT